MYKYFIMFCLSFATNYLCDAQIKKPVAAIKKPIVNEKVTVLQTNSKLYVVASVLKGGIAIRWAAANYRAWALLNKYGYKIERYTVMAKKKMVKEIKLQVFGDTTKPMPLKNWDTTLLQKDDYAAVIAQALYGEDFDMTMNGGGKVQSMVSLSKTQTQRYTMAMYAADHSFNAAIAAGLGLFDSTASPNEQYLYKIHSLVPKNQLKIDTGNILIGLADVKPLPKPGDILPQAADKNIMLAWEFDNLVKYYGSYYVERSDDGGKSFHSISERPVTKLVGSTEGAPNGSVVFSDTIPNNTTEYKYRVAGLTLFDEVGPYSNVVTVKGITKIETAPRITGVINVSNGKGTLTWQVEDSVVHLFKYFELSSSPTSEGVYKMEKTNIPVVDRSMLLDSITPDAAYLTITAVAREGENKTSLPFLLQAEDSIAPAVPQGLKATIDTNGIVKINWTANTEKDLLGYKIYKTYIKEQELTPMVDSVWQKTNFIDTVQIKNLNSKIFYSIKAIDKRYNQSEYAPLLEVKKPDLIPPTQPVFSDFLIRDTAIILTWINSADKDLKYTKLMRKELTDSANSWVLIEQFNGAKTSTYLDKTGMGGSTYAYTLISEDSSNLNSTPALPITVLIPIAFDKTAIKNLELVVDRDKRTITANWEIKTKQPYTQIELYRGTDKEKLSLYKVLEGNILTYLDEDLKVNTKYQYGIRVVFEVGKTSAIKIKKTNY